MQANQPVTKKPNETRLGRGKANAKYWFFSINKGSALIEIKGCKLYIAKQKL
jgi:large subunit ribosomal protein L16